MDYGRRFRFLGAWLPPKFTRALLPISVANATIQRLMFEFLRRLHGTSQLSWWHLRGLLAEARSSFRKDRRERIMGLLPQEGAERRGRALVSYMAAPATWPADSPRFSGHSNAWESAEIVRQLRRSGYEVDVIDWSDRTFVIDGAYDLVIDIHGNLARSSRFISRRVLHVTGSHPQFSNSAEDDRLSAVQLRRGVALRPRRRVASEQVCAFDESLKIADVVTLIGNRTTLSTFPPEIQPKIRLVTVSGSTLSRVRSPEALPEPKEFLWFAGSGAVHKGMDLVLELFANHPHLTLHCVGPYRRELDFVRAYRRELFSLPNIVDHGFLSPSGERFFEIASRCCGFIMPSCSEGISPAAVTSLQFGLVPIISSRCGIDLPSDAGWVLDACSLDTLTEALAELCDQPLSVLRAIVGRAQSIALIRYSRMAFTMRLTEALSDVLAQQSHSERTPYMASASE